MDFVRLLAIIEKFYISYSLPAIFLSSLIEISPFGWSVPGGSMLIVGGFFAYGKTVSLIGVLSAGWLGAWTTFVLAYILGRKTGYWLVKKLHQEKNAQKARLILKNHGGAILTTSMMSNLIRFWMAYIAGAQKYSFSKFFFYSMVASLGWVSLMVIIGYLAGTERSALETGIARASILGWFLFGLAFLVIYLSIKRGLREFKEEEKNENY